jgi:hypothetical protein
MTGSSPGMGIGSCIGPVCTTGFCMVWAQPLGPRAISGPLGAAGTAAPVLAAGSVSSTMTTVRVVQSIVRSFSTETPMACFRNRAREPAPWRVGRDYFTGRE